MDFDPRYFAGMASHTTDYLSYGDVLVHVSAANLWAFVLHGVITNADLDDLKSRGYQVIWAREAMLHLQPCSVNSYYIGQRTFDFTFYAFI